MTLESHDASDTHAPASGWADAVRHMTATGTFRVQDIKTVLGDPIGGIVVSAAPDRETTYRLAGYGN
jgi:hypothetical protein